MLQEVIQNFYQLILSLSLEVEEIRLELSFNEYVSALKVDKYECYLWGLLFEQTYIKDIVERNNINIVDSLDTIINMLASAIVSLTNSQKIYDTFKSNGEKELSLNTVSYIKNI